MISAGEARETIVSNVRSVGHETSDLHNAHARVLAIDVTSALDIPPFDNSSMDGYAVRVADLLREDKTGMAKLRLVGEVGAGDVFARELGPSLTVRTLTGAPIPSGADAIVEQELVKISDGSVLVPRTVDKGRNICRRGEDMRKGEVVMRKGTVLRAAHLGVLASLGIDNVSVQRRPRVAYVTTGNELVEVTEELLPGKIRNSNAYALWGQIKECGCEPVNLGIARDNEQELTQRLTEGLRHDVLITSGGASVGDYDFVLAVLKKLGTRILFWKVNIKPGMPFAFGIYENPDASQRVPVFALPGNPVSTMVTFIQFVLPALKKIRGEENPAERLKVTAKLEHDITKKDSKRHFSRGILRNENGTFVVRTTGSQSSGVLSSLVKANCLLHIPEEKLFLRAGEDVEVEIL